MDREEANKLQTSLKAFIMTLRYHSMFGLFEPNNSNM
jgi:hypothetical protein